MKKALLVFTMSVFLTGNLAYAQNTKGDFLVGAGIGYHFDFEEDNLGLVVEGLYSFTDDVRAAAGIMYYFVDDDNFTYYDINVNAHYLFLNEEDYAVYALAGLNNFRWSNGFSDDELAINLGLGGEYDLDAIMLFGELKLTTGDVHDNNFLFHGGLRYRF